MQCVAAIAMRFERGRRRGQRPRRAAEIAGGKRHLGFGDDAARPRQILVRAKATGGAAQQLAGARVLAELRHGDAAQGKRRRIVAQGDPLESTDCIAASEGAGGSGDKGLHDDRLLRRVAAYYFRGAHWGWSQGRRLTYSNAGNGYPITYHLSRSSKLKLLPSPAVVPPTQGSVSSDRRSVRGPF